MTQLYIDIAGQSLWVQALHRAPLSFMVATAANGAGERNNSECTPRGHHQIAQKIGDGCPENTVFVGREPTGEIYDAQQADKDWILTRILWLRGLEEGRNAGKDCDSHQRYIYIHGTPDSVPMGIPSSHGCIRMRNSDIVKLFAMVSTGDSLWIK